MKHRAGLRLGLLGLAAVAFGCSETGAHLANPDSMVADGGFGGPDAASPDGSATDAGDDGGFAWPDAAMPDASVADAGPNCLSNIDCTYPYMCQADGTCGPECMGCGRDLVCPGEPGKYHCEYSPGCSGNPSDDCGYCQYYQEDACDAPAVPPSTIEIRLTNFFGCVAANNSECHKTTTLDFDADRVHFVFSWIGTYPEDGNGSREVYSGPLPEELRDAWRRSTPQLWCQQTINSMCCFFGAATWRDISAARPGFSNTFGSHETFGRLPAKPVEDAIRATEEFVAPIWADAGVPYEY